MGSSKHFTIALLCVVLYSLRSDAKEGNGNGRRASLGELFGIPDDSTAEPFSLPSSLPTGNSFVFTHPITTNEPFLDGAENILGTPSRRKVFRRTRRRRKKMKTSTESADLSLSTSTERVRTTQVEVTQAPTRNPNFKIEVVPFNSDQSGSTTESDFTSSSATPSTGRLTNPVNIFKPGHYTRHQSNRKRVKPKSTLWKNQNFSMELFDTDATDEISVSNVDKRESNNMFSMKPTALSRLPDMNTEESTNPFVNTSLPISTELHNSLQFTLQVLHPLLNSDSVLTGKEPKIPEDKTVAVTHSLSSSVADTPIAPDLRFLPTHLRKSHPLLSSEDSITNSNTFSKVGPRVNAFPHGMHSINNRPSTSTSTTTTEKSRSRGRTSSTTTTSTTTPKSTTTRTTTLPTTTSTWRRITSTERSTTVPSGRRTSIVPIRTHGTTPKSKDGPMGNLRITEIVYPTVVQSVPDSSNSHNRVNSPSTSTTPTTTKPSTTSSVRTPSIYDHSDHRSPPLILMGTDTSASEMDKGSIESPPAFDDLLLEELVKGYNPGLMHMEQQVTYRTTPSTTTSTTTTTTTTPPPTTTTRRTTTTTPTTTTRRTTTTTRPTTTTTTTTTTVAPSPPPPPKVSDDETNQLLQLLSLLQQQQQPQIPAITVPQTTEAIKTSTVGKLDDELLKNLALLDNLLSPTAKTMIKEAVDSGTTEKIKAAQNAPGEGLSDADLKAIYMLLDSMSSTTARPAPTTTTTTPKPTIHPALQGMLTMLTNPWSDIQKMRAQQGQGQNLPQAQPTAAKPLFSIPQPPQPVPTTSSFDLLSQLFNLNPQTEKPKANPMADLGLGSLFGNFLPKRQSNNNEATSGSNQLLSFFQPEPAKPVSPPPSGPYYWFDVNAFLGNDPTSGSTSGFRPKMGTRDYFLKVRKRRDSMERYR
ncbi:unnamed protein product [Orchesella dallaii]|uniref:Uncharacterized protein n=1 Tax=Orchesella dallaii TaxID=48710 RepID=A0ABP1S9R3_9HEXA